MNQDRSSETQRRKAPDACREAILDAGQGLSMARAWETQTIADKLEDVRTSERKFFDHLTARENFLTGIVSRMTERAADAAWNRASVEALAGLNAVLAGSFRGKAEPTAEMWAFAAVSMRPSNNVLAQRVIGAMADTVPEEMISEGVQEGVIDIADQRLAAETVIGLTQGGQTAPWPMRRTGRLQREERRSKSYGRTDPGRNGRSTCSA